MSTKNEPKIVNKLMERKAPFVLDKYNIEDFAEDVNIDQLTHLAASICQTPIAHISFFDKDKLIVVGKFGIDDNINSVPKRFSFCQYTAESNDILEIEDAQKDSRFSTNPFVFGEPYVRFYAGMPLRSKEGINMGALCVLDIKPKQLSEDQKNALRFLSEVMIINMELKAKKLELEEEQRRLGVSEKRFRDLFELSEGLIGEHDLNGRIISANRATARSLETTVENLIGRNMRDTLEPESREFFDFYLEKIAEDGHAEGIMHVKTTTGKSRYWKYKNIKVEENGYPYVLCYSQDVTDMVNMEKELRNAEKITKQSIEAKQQFLAKVTHEIRTPMNAIVGFGKLLAKTNLEDKQRKFVDAISTSGENLLLIVNDLLDTAKIEAGKMTMEEIPFSLKEVVSSVVTILHYKAAEKDLVLSVKINDDVPDYLIGDPTRLNQVLVNLASNAVKFTEKGSVEILIHKMLLKDNHVTLCFDVSDTGIGIAEDKLPTIFDSFTQANNDTSRKYGGTGLGLTIARQIIELQNGAIKVDSTLGKGTTFTFILSYPLADTQKAIEKTTPEGVIDVRQLRNVKILLAEDNHLNHLLMESIMAEWGVEMKIAVNGKQVIDMIHQEHFDLILMDVHMPEMDGYEATRYIRDHEKEPLSQIPIIAITANASEEDKQKCFDSGMVDFIPKPFRPEDLFLKISRYAHLTGDIGFTSKKRVEKKTESKKRVIRLGYLRGIASGNKKFLKEVMEIFIVQIPQELILLEEALEERNWGMLADTAHKMKLGINVMGMKESEKMILYIETESREKIAPNEDTIRGKIEKLKEKCMLAVEEVKSLMVEWKL
ncbi:MAG TPA: ATP-binding protein [Cytophagaceae bacterium]|nr:ATP-binding protein [Cytophagaceae bacterium]